MALPHSLRAAPAIYPAARRISVTAGMRNALQFWCLFSTARVSLFSGTDIWVLSDYRNARENYLPELQCLFRD